LEIIEIIHIIKNHRIPGNSGKESKIIETLEIRKILESLEIIKIINIIKNH